MRISVTIAAVLALFLVVFLYSTNRQGRAGALLRAVPPGAEAAMAWPDAGQWARKSDSLVLPESLRQDIGLFRSALARLGEHTTGAIVLFLEQRGPEGPALGAIVEWRGGKWTPGQLTGSSEVPALTKFRGQQISTIDMGSGRTLCAARQGKLLVLGRFPFLVESVIGHLRGDRGPFLLPRIFRKLDREQAVSWLPAAWLGKAWSGSPGWFRLTVQADTGSLHLQGRFRSTGRNGTLPWLAGAASGRPGAILQVLPEAVSRLQWRHCERAAAAWPAFGKEKDLMRQYLLPMAGREQAYAVTGPKGGDSRFWVLEMTDDDSAADQLGRLAQEVGLLEDYDYQTYRVRRLQIGRFTPPGGVASFKDPFFVQLERFLVFASSRPALELWIDQYLVGATLGRSTDFLRFLEANPAPAHAWWIARPAAAEHLLAQPGFRSSFAALSAGCPWIGVQWEGGGRNGVLVHGNWPCRQEKADNTGIRLIWRAELGTPARIAPQILAFSGQRSFIAVQDVRNRMYLFDSGGQTVWTQRLDGPVHPPVVQVDYYRDGNRQLLFNSRDAVHLLDLATGRETGNFPLHLQSPATNPLTLIDTTGLGDYAFFVACANGNIYGYDLQGLPVKGWGPLVGVGQIKHPLLHFQDQDKDFMVVLNEEGTLFVFRRDGQPRFPPKPFADTFPSPPAFQVHPSSARIAAVNQDGTAYVVSLSGEEFRLRLLDRPARPVHFAFADVTGDDRHDYIALSGRSLTVHSYQATSFRQTGSFAFSHAQSDVFTLALPGESRPTIATVDTVRRQIHLIDPPGKVRSGFPLAGATTFTVSNIFGDGRKILVVAEGEVVYAYELE